MLLLMLSHPLRFILLLFLLAVLKKKKGRCFLAGNK